MTKCVFPNCSFTGSPEYCFRHKEKGIKQPNKPKPIKKVSDREKARKAELKKMYPVFLSKPENALCGLKLKGCLGKATVIHHLRGRIGDQVFEVKDWMASCIWCNIQVENDPKAIEKGLKIKQHSNG